VSLAERFGGQAIAFGEVTDALEQVDIIISSTGSPRPIITRDQVKSRIRRRRNRPLFFIDIAVPRDIDPEINSLTNTYVYDIDDLKGVIEENVEERNREAVKAERIVDEAVFHFRRWLESLEVTPTIVALRDKVQNIAAGEVEKTLKGMEHLGEEDRRAIVRMKEAMVKKILHDPTIFLKSNGCHGDNAVYLDVVRKLFQLDDQPDD
jgi:glutamyl-tRNA reductase